MDIARYIIPFYEPDLDQWSLEARLLRWLTFLWILIGLVTLFSASYAVGLDSANDGWYYFKRQLVWVFIGLILFKIVIQSSIQNLLKIAPWFYLGILFLIALTVLGFGVEINGAQRWLKLGPIQIQPSELLKPFLVLQAASIFATWKRTSWKVKGTWLGIFALTLACILKQPNLSTTSLCGMTLWLMALAGGIPYIQLIVTAVMGVATAATSISLNPYQLKRVTSFTNPWVDARGDGYQLIQSLLAIGSGGKFGAGFGMSQQKLFYLPFQYTDFIFAIFAEEFGFVGTSLLLSLLFIYSTIGLVVAVKSLNPVKRLVAMGATIILIGQSLLNIAVNTGSLPTTGLPFPFLSYGGSSFMSSFILAGLLIRIAIEINEQPNSVLPMKN
jgi:cell division protein FtsW